MPAHECANRPKGGGNEPGRRADRSDQPAKAGSTSIRKSTARTTTDPEKKAKKKGAETAPFPVR
ncbi:hypothetical protein AZI85_16760 [Bdellovibrio bacteriovorus]|uniref:Uncharacterized protein n=1 Tax=Bdellovibrio bacteriovorus TaxID=959 RepID=A0A150WTV9_BDEBC|nr:hypothetical protein AZI85_16760 [Bdellovibrio bacteriovorus]